MGKKSHNLQSAVSDQRSLDIARKWLDGQGVGDWSSEIILVLAFIAGALFAMLILSFRSRKSARVYNWLGRQITHDGYIRRIYSSGRGKYEHRVVAESIMGRRLERWEVVHHINGRKADNRPDNLCVMHYQDHERYHEWYDWIYKTYGKYPRRETQLQKLVEDFNGILLSSSQNRKANRA